MEEVEEGKGRTNGDGRILTWSGEHMIHCTNDVLWNCTLETVEENSAYNCTKKKKKVLSKLRHQQILATVFAFNHIIAYTVSPDLWPLFFP